MQWDILWKAAVLTVVIFIVGILVGAFMDISRVSEASGRLTEIDLQWNDARLQALYSDSKNDTASCEAAIKANLDFNERIYAEGRTIERYEAINRFAPQLVYEKKRYALLQLEFWLNSLELKKRCGADYTVLAYFYSHYNQSLEMDQKLQSAVLTQLKEECGNAVLLVPLPSDMGLSSIELVKKNYGISSAPSILVNEEKVLSGVQSLSDLGKLVGC
ncbi:MAG: hypothetical protein QXD77_02520 [Candidatus Aenigmatarchaeota archaeon]